MIKKLTRQDVGSMSLRLRTTSINTRKAKNYKGETEFAIKRASKDFKENKQRKGGTADT